MIIWSTQRGNGQDVATHFLNSLDNEVVELLEIVGFVSENPHGAMAETQLQAETMTKCRNYIYSVAVNPDPKQPAWTEEMRIDHRDRMFQALGLDGQPYFAVRHVKHGREHYHYAISRIDAENGKAIHLSFDHDKQMKVSRSFCRDWGIELPKGYEKGLNERSGEQLLLHEKRQQEITGISKEERKKIVTELWQRSDSAKAFVTGLEEHGYILCTGKRDYVLLDYYGGMNALPRLVAGREIRIADIRDRLKKDFPPEELPDVEEAKNEIDKYRSETEKFDEFGGLKFKKGQLEWAQKRKQADIERRQIERKKRYDKEEETLLDLQRGKRNQLRREYFLQRDAINHEREQSQRTGVAAVFARYSGYELFEQKRQRFQDHRRLQEYQREKELLVQKQNMQTHQLQLQQKAQIDALEREKISLAQVAKREKQALQTQNLRNERMIQRKGPEHVPSNVLEYSPWQGRKANLLKAKNKFVEMVEEKIKPLGRSVKNEHQEENANQARSPDQVPEQPEKNPRHDFDEARVEAPAPVTREPDIRPNQSQENGGPSLTR